MEDFMREDNSTAGNSDVLVPTDEGSGALFAPYCSVDFLNNQKIINDTVFFVFAPTPYLTYYWTVVRRNLEWYNGYVTGIHNQGILSTKTGARICKMSANLTLGGGISFQGDETAENFLTDFYKTRKVYPKLKRVTPMLNAIGFMLSKVDINAKGELDICFVPGNRYFAQTDADGNVLEFYACINFMTADATSTGDNSTTGQFGYYLVEERFYRRGKPCVRYRVYQGATIATAPTFGGGVGREHGSKGIELGALPPHVQRMIKQKCAGYELNKIYVLPFESIGARITRNSFSATGVDDYSCFADSTLADVHTQLYELDLTKTQKNEHKYINQDFMVMPDNMILEIAGDSAKAKLYESRNGYSGVNRRIAKGATYADPTKAVPFVYSPPLKIADYNADIMQIHNEIAAQTEFSPVTIAGYLRNGVEKTATEITADENATRLTVRTKRELIADDLNYLNNIILHHYGLVGNAAAVFKEGSLSNPRLETELIIRKLENGLITQEMAVQEANPQLGQRECDEIVEQAKQEQKERQAQPFDGLDGISV